VHRLYRDAGLSLRRKKRKHLMRQKAVFPRVQNSNEEWALDFATDALASHRHLRILSIVEAPILAGEGDHRLPQRSSSSHRWDW
jgi:putative transposase